MKKVGSVMLKSSIKLIFISFLLSTFSTIYAEETTANSSSLNLNQLVEQLTPKQQLINQLQNQETEVSTKNAVPTVDTNALLNLLNSGMVNTLTLPFWVKQAQEQWVRLTPMQQQNFMQKSMTQWQSLSAAQQSQISTAVQNVWKALPPQQQTTIAQQEPFFMKNLSAEQQQQFKQLLNQAVK